MKVTTVVPGLMRTRGEAHAMFKGKPASERAWFSVAAEMPGLAMSARRAARRIVRAVERGQAEIVVGIPARSCADEGPASEPRPGRPGRGRPRAAVGAESWVTDRNGALAFSAAAHGVAVPVRGRPAIGLALHLAGDQRRDEP